MEIFWYALIIILLLSWGFPYYVSVSTAWDEGNLSIGDKIVHAVPMLIFGTVDMFAELTVASVFFWEPPYRHGLTVSSRARYWIKIKNWHSGKLDDWRYGCAHAVHVQTRKYDKTHIIEDEEF